MGTEMVMVKKLMLMKTMLKKTMLMKTMWHLMPIQARGPWPNAWKAYLRNNSLRRTSGQYSIRQKKENQIATILIWLARLHVMG